MTALPEADAPDTYEPHRTTFPRRLWASCERLAGERGLTMAGYLVGLMRADLVAAGEVVPAPPPVKRNGPRPAEPSAELLAWVGTLAPGTRGTAAELLAAFLASHPDAESSCWNPVAFGRALSRVCARVVARRYLARLRARKGGHVFEVQAFTPAGTPP